MSGFPLYCILVGICIGSFLMSMDVFVISTAVPSITAEFHDTTQIGWYPAAYSLTTCALLPLAGKLASIFPLRWVYQVFFAIFLVGSIVCGAATSSNMFIVGRAIAGVGAAGVASGGLTIVLTVSSAKNRAMFMGLASSMFALGIILAPIIGGALTDRVTWRWCFWINLPAGALTLATQFFFFKPRNVHAERTAWQRLKSLDLVGCALFVPACFLILVALQWGGTKYAWNSGTIIGLFVGGGLLTIIFVAWEWWVGEMALIPGVVMGRRQVLLACIFAFLQLGSLAVMSYYLPTWFQAVQGVNPLDSGVRVLPSVLMQIVALGIVGSLANKLGYYNPWFFVGSALMCVAAGLYTTFSAFNTSTGQWVGYQIIQGLGVGLTMQVPTLVLQQDLEHSPLMSIGVSMGLFSQYFGASVEQVIAGSIFNTYLKSRLHELSLDDAQIGFLLRAGTINVRRTAEEFLPDMVDELLEAYNFAITRVYFVPVVACGLAFVVACGLKWKRIELTQTKGGEKAGDEEQQNNPNPKNVPGENQEHGEKVAVDSRTLSV
ncbi:Major facilitator superfamily domain containing protein [Rhypophila decipiens]